MIGYRTDGSPCATGNPALACTSIGPGSLWTLSASDTDPFVNSGPLADTATLYLWFQCEGWSGWGIQLAEFALAGDLLVIDLTPRPGFLSMGTVNEVLLSATGCPAPPLVAAELTVAGATSVDTHTWGSVQSLYR
jgi:hypothetical protein